VRALLALVTLDEGIAKLEGSVAQSLALVERTKVELAQLERVLGATREELQRRERAGAEPTDIEELRRSLRGKERRAARLMRLAETKQNDALVASRGLRNGCADLAVRRGAITSRVPREALEDYESALRRGLLPAAVATRGKVCWGCFHPLSAAVAAAFLNAQAFVRCPHCERVLFNPDWNERP
jgi:predicted  nucleic acid-binding Zn-ribbon protein